MKRKSLKMLLFLFHKDFMVVLLSFSDQNGYSTPDVQSFCEDNKWIIVVMPNLNNLITISLI